MNAPSKRGMPELIYDLECAFPVKLTKLVSLNLILVYLITSIPISSCSVPEILKMSNPLLVEQGLKSKA